MGFHAGHNTEGNVRTLAANHETEFKKIYSLDLLEVCTVFVFTSGRGEDYELDSRKNSPNLISSLILFHFRTF